MADNENIRFKDKEEAKQVLLFCVMNLLNVFAITREELIDQLKYEQDAANTFERRIHRRVKPVAWIAGE
ncbi:hypothetical protein WR25_07804 [Diploscapter pachys]|uniref:Uncharacterized protein n=1 Tax=Diploscapter pachys TaxID=2018661 RepID=A0A2A2JPR8_9BILA|nr:hypothetical protein WR25_07804 [Diploscapter pachys]